MALEKVLVVDDDPNICDVLRMYLENGYHSLGRDDAPIGRLAGLP